MNSYNSPSTKPLFKGRQIVWYILMILEIMLAFRFILKFTGANAGAGFSNFVYSITWPLVAPFLAVFPIGSISTSIFEWTTLLAMVVYWIVALVIVQLFLISKTMSTPEAAAGLEV